jgi:hypothetical protein
MNLTNNPNINTSSNSFQNGTINNNTPTNLSGTLNITQGIEKGQVIQGEIIDLKNNDISLVLQDGRMISGKLTNASSHAIGDKVSLSVVDVSAKNLTLKMIESSYEGASSNTIDKALEAAFLSKNDRNRTILKELLNHQMSIDKISIQNLIKQSVTFKNTDITTLVLMNKYSIPVNEGNINQIIKFMNMEQNMLHDLNDLADSVINTLKNNSQTLSSLSLEQDNISYTKLLQNNSKLMDFIIKDGTVPSQTTNTSLNSIITEEELTIINNFIKESNQLNEGNPSLSSNLFPLLSSDSEIAHTLPMLKELVSQNLTNNKPEVSTILQQLTSKSENPSTNYPNNIGQILDDNQLEDLGNLLKNFSFSEGTLNEINAGTIDVNTLLTLIHENSSLVSNDILKETFASKELQTLLKDTLLNKWTITPEEFKQKEHMKEHLDNLLKASAELKDLLKESPMSTTINPGNQTVHLQDNLNFINHLNQLFQYIPLPLKLKQQNTNGELYVYSNKRTGSSLSEGIKVLLHLDMDNLGKTDIYIEMKDNQIFSKFYFDEEDTINLVSSHIDELSELLIEKGYAMKSEILIRESNINPMKEIIGEDDNVTINRYNFDLRA